MARKFCVNCVYHEIRPWEENNEGSGYDHLCSYDDERDLVTGNPRFPYCDDERASSGKCGPLGRRFVEKEKAFMQS